MAMASNESRLVIVIDAKNAERTASALNNELQNITTSGNQADKQVGVLGTSIRALAGYMAGVVTVGAAINKMDAYTNLQNRLKLVTNSQQALNQATNDTFKIAQDSRQAWESVVQVYQRFSDNAKTLNLNMEQTAELTDTVAKSIAISGASTQAAEAALTQFGQALASGVLRGEEFNSISEQAPALLKAIANGLGVNIGQLRAMAAEGQLTGDIVVKALQKSKESVDELFGRTDMTIGQSFTMLNNEVQKFIGEAGKGSGAAELLAGSIKTLAENLSLVTNAAIVVGVGYLTKAIVAKTIAVQADIAATIAQRGATVANAQAEVALAAAKVKDSQATLASIQATSASTRARVGAITIAQREKVATDELAAAKARLAATEKAAQAAAITSTRVGAGLLGVLGGPVGIGITVASLAAGYLLMRDNTAKANEKLEEQGAIANKTTEELLKLEGAQRSGAKRDLAEAFKAQNEELERLDTLIGNSIAKISSKNTADAETARILREVRTGVMDYETAFNTLNKTQAASPDVIKKLREEIDKYEEQRLIVQKNADAQKILGVEVQLSGNKAQNTVGQYNAQANALDGVKSSANSASKALQEYNKSLGDRAYDAAYIKTLREKYGYTKELAEETLKLQIAEKGRTSKGVAQKDIDRVDGVLKLESAVKSLDETERKRQSNLSKAASKTQKDAERAQKESERLAEQRQKEADQLAKEQGESRVAIAYSYLNETARMEEDFQREIAEIRKANFGPEQAEFEKKAKERYDFEHEMYLLQITEEINLYQWSEQDKLDHWKRTQETIIQDSGKYNKEIKALKLKSLNDEYNLEKAFLEISRQQRAFQAREQFMDETTRINEKYRLEQAEILKINDAKERAFMLDMSRLKKETEQQERLNKAKLGVSANQTQASGTGVFVQIETDRFDQIGQSDELFQAQLATNFEAREQLWQEHVDRVNEINERADQARLSLQLDYGEQITGSLADMFRQQGDEQSAAYKVMFAASKAFAIAQSLISIQQGIAQAAANPWPLNLAAMASVAASTASLVGNIKAVADVGFKTGGYTGSGGVSDVAGVVHGQEYVLNAAATKRVGVGTLDAINSGGSLGGGINVTIENYGTTKQFEVQQLDEQNVRIIARDEAEKTVTRSMRDPNSPISKSISQNTQANRRRG